METLRETIIKELQTVIDPETGADVWRTHAPACSAGVRLVENLTVDQNGHVNYRYCPSSPFCSLAVPLAQNIKNTVSWAPGVMGWTIEVVNYVQASLLTELLNEL